LPTITLTGATALLAQAVAQKLGVSVEDAADRAFFDLLGSLAPRVQSRAEVSMDALVTRFLAEKCGRNDAAYASNTAVYSTFLRWSGQAYSHKALSQALNRQGFTQRIIPGKGREWIGFNVKQYDADPALLPDGPGGRSMPYARS
jgi:hypothetical protein